MNYNETLEFLFSQLPAYHRIGKAAYKDDLNNTIALDNYFGHPHLDYKTIHIAGTNGKGSVSHMVASVLQEAGYRTGLYTSPHLKDFRERIKVNGVMITEKEIVTFVTKNKGIIGSLKPSFFEMTVAMAFNHFAKCKVDVAIIEVGLGGRLDSTNIIKPVLSVITNIGHDHMDLLGDTIRKVAIEKAGIIKESVPVVISETQPEIMDVFISKASESGSAICFADSDYKCSFESYDFLNRVRAYKVADLQTKVISSGESALVGNYQEKNIQAVYSVFKNLHSIFSFRESHISDGIRNVLVNTDLMGRWQVIGNDPLTICDTGHNLEGLEYLMNQLNHIPRSGLHMIIGFVNDKDLKSVLPLFPLEAHYYFTKASVPRALNEDILRVEASKYELNGESYSDVKSALDKARKNAAPHDIIFIGGSTFIVAEVV